MTEPTTEAAVLSADNPRSRLHRIDHADGKGWSSWRCIPLADAIEAAQPADTLDVLTLANIIREVDGNHDLGAAELAERIIARLGRKP